MGIPYSKQINAAFDQVTPLVASAYEVLETTKNIALFITAIQIGIIVLLFFNLLALLGLLFSLNPDLEQERKTLVTPAMKWIASWTMAGVERKYSVLGVLVGWTALVSFAYLSYIYWVSKSADEIAEELTRRDKEFSAGDEESSPDGDDGGKASKDDKPK